MEEFTPRCVSLQEMQSMLMADAYKDFRDQIGYGNEPEQGLESEQDFPIVENWLFEDNIPLLYRHLCAELMLADSESEERNEQPAAYNPRYLIRLTELLMHPLVWMNEIRDDIVVDGRWAQEQYSPERANEVKKYIQLLTNQSLEYFALDLPCLIEDDRVLGYKHGEVFWPILTADYEPLISKAFGGEHIDEEEFKHVTTFDKYVLERQLDYIAQTYDGSAALFILRLLQNDWKRLKTWGSGMKNMTDKQIQEFEQVLLNGFDEKIVEWEKMPTPPISQPKEAPKQNPTIAPKEDQPADEPDTTKFTVSEKPDWEETCAEKLINIINYSKYKSDACRRIQYKENAKFFNIIDVSYPKKAKWANSWIPRTRKNWNFTEDDFKKANPESK